MFSGHLFRHFQSFTLQVRLVEQRTYKICAAIASGGSDVTRLHVTLQWIGNYSGYYVLSPRNRRLAPLPNPRLTFRPIQHPVPPRFHKLLSLRQPAV